MPHGRRIQSWALEKKHCGKISIHRALSSGGEQKSLSADFLERELKILCNSSLPQKWLVLLWGLWEPCQTCGLWIRSVQKQALNLGTAIQLTSVTLKLAFSDCFPKMLPHEISIWEEETSHLLTKPGHDFGAVMVPVATSASSSLFAVSPACIRMGNKHPLSRKNLSICFDKCLNAFLNRNGLKQKRIFFNLDHGADTITNAHIMCLNIKSQSVSSSERWLEGSYL